MDASNLQVSFLGGEIAPSFQGRADHPKYKSGLNKCYNSMPLETGAWTRRPGTRTAAPTRGGVYAKTIDFDFSQNAPYTAEFTDSHLRFFSSYSLVHTYDGETVLSISTANPAVVTVSANTAYSDGDMVEFSFANVDLTPEQGALLQGRQFLISGTSGATFALYDSITGLSIDGSTLNFATGTPASVQRVLDIAAPYSRAMLPDIRAIQALNGNVNTLVLLNAKVPPQALTSTEPPLPTFALAAASFVDGPYNDPITDGTTITPSAVSGSVTLTASTSKFATTDVGRHIRLLSQPANYAAGTTYAVGALVTYLGAYYTSLVAANTGNTPGADAAHWGVAANATAWVWGVITAYTSATVVTATLKVVNTSTLQLPGILVNTNAITTWRLGTFSDTTGYPACGTYHEGRLALSGVIGNRFDMSVPNDIFNFSPTAVDGTVSDANAISYTFNAKDINTIFWMTPQHTGMLCGTQAGEWLVQASSNNDPLTPTSCQAKRVTKYGSANVEPVEAPFATLFVARNNKKLFEYLADVFSGKFSGINVSLTGSHLTASGIAEIRYQKELTPVLWARMNDGTLAGMTYRRESAMLSEQPAFSGWHSHALGTGRSITSISIGPSVGGDLDTLTMVTFDSVNNIYYVELLTDLFPENGANTDAWFLDGATTPAGSVLTGFGASATQLEIYGLENYNGETITAYVAGIDAGDYVVSSGTATIPLPAGPLTGATIAAATNVNNFSPSAMPVSYSTPSFPTASASVQAYIGPITPVTGTQGDTVLIDVANSRIFNFKDGQAATDGIRVFDIMSGNQINQAVYAQVFPGRAGSIDSPYTLGDDGRIYTTSGPSNSTTFMKIDPDTLKVLDTAGKVSSATTAAPNSIAYPRALAAISVGGKYFVLAPSLSGAQLNVVEMTDGFMQNAGHNVPTFVDHQLTSCPGEKGSGIGYTIGWGAPAGAYTAGYNLYKTTITEKATEYNLKDFPTFQNSHIVTAKVGASIAPTDIDATWTIASEPLAMIFDHSDGNLLMFANNSVDAVTNKNYIMKVNSATGAIMWKTAIEDAWVGNTMAGSSSYAAFGTYAFMSQHSIGVCSYNQVNTITGAVTNTVVVGANSTNSVWDSRLGALFVYGDQTTGGSSPVALNSTPASFTNWYALRLTAGATIATGRQFYIVPALVGKTFTSQGQRMRPLEPQDTGARNGPALGKTRRNHRAAFLFLNAAGLKFGAAFTALKSILFKTPGNTAYAANQLYSGVFSDTITDDYSYDGMIAWQCDRPYPATVLSNEGFLQTQDR